MGVKSLVEMTFKLFHKTYRAECYMLINQRDQDWSVGVYITISIYWLPYTSPKYILHNKGRICNK